MGIRERLLPGVTGVIVISNNPPLQHRFYVRTYEAVLQVSAFYSQLQAKSDIGD